MLGGYGVGLLLELLKAGNKGEDMSLIKSCIKAWRESTWMPLTGRLENDNCVIYFNPYQVISVNYI